MHKALTSCYVIVCVLHVFLLAISDPPISLLVVTKALAMPLLMAVVAKAKSSLRKGHTLNLLMTALFFSFLGDVFLLTVFEQYNLFLFGLTAFLMTHVIYSFIFLKSGTGNRKTSLIIPTILTLGILTWVLLFYNFIREDLQSMMLPVAVYMIVITTMSLAAVFRYGRVSNPSYSFVLVGAILFMVSDMVLAMNKFVGSVEYGSVIIMSTYLAAQYFIVKGILLEQYNFNSTNAAHD